MIRHYIEECPTWYCILIIVAALFLLTSFIMPPSGAIDPSVLKGVSILAGMGLIGMMPVIIKATKSKDNDTKDL